MRTLHRLGWLSATLLVPALLLCRCTDPFAYTPTPAPDLGPLADASSGDDRDNSPIILSPDRIVPSGDQPGDDATAEASTDGGSDVAADTAADVASEPAPCDLTKGPKDAPCVTDDPQGVFVSPTGSDDVTTPGTQSRPVKTIGHGMAVARLGKRVYVCEGTYPESIAVDMSRDGVSVYGGLDCASWTYASRRVVVAPALPGYALQVSGLMLGVTFEDVEFDAQDANPSHPGESSVAVFVESSSNVALHRVAIVAGNGAPGAGAIGVDGGIAGDGGSGVDAGAVASNHFARPLDGIRATSGAGASGLMCACPDGTSSTGGQGGTQSSFGNAAPVAGLPSYGVAGAGAAGINTTACNMAGSGGNGVDAPSNGADTPNTSWGVLSASGWVPAPGRAGSDGQPGQGGGGGGDGTGSTGVAAGGGGGCGGCGGAGGKAEGGGGASIALLSYESAITLVGCALTAHDAGSGGPGGNGEVGQPGGYAGLPYRGGCQGAVGGTGTGGNGAQGGAGGLSLGIGYSGTAPTIDGTPVTQAAALTSITTGKAGSGGPKGIAGPAAPLTTGQPGVDGANGKDGIAQAVMAL